MRNTVAGLVVIALATHAHAETADTKSPAVAVSLSVGVTVAGAGMLFVPNDGVKVLGSLTMLFGPSVGRWYAGDGSAAGLGIRTLGGAIAITGAILLLQDSCDSDSNPCTTDKSDLAILVSGSLVWLGGAALDTVRGYQAARRSRERPSGLAFAPTMITTPASRAAGFALGGTF